MTFAELPDPLFIVRHVECGYVKDDIGDRAEVTSLVATLAATLEKLLTAICG